MAGAATTREIVFIDASVEDLPGLLAGLRADLRPVVLDAARPGLTQIAEALAEGAFAQAHLIAHGAPGQIRLGLDAFDLEAVRRDEVVLAEIGRAVGPQGSICLWSCETAAGDRGEAFMDALAEASGVAVAASRGLIGQARRGGAWVLDKQTGAIEAQPPLTAAAMETYGGVMPINSVDIATVTVTGDDVVVSGTAGYNNLFSFSEDLYLYVRGGQYGNTWTLIKTYSDVGGFWGVGTLNWSHPLNNLAAGTYEFRVTDEASIIGDDTDTYSGVVIAAANSPPDAVNDTLSAVLEDSGPRSIAASTLLANDTDADKNSLSVTAVSNAVGGTVSLSGSTVTFTPNANFNGSASFDYTVSDGKGGTDTATASFNVTAVNDAPVAVDDTLTVVAGQNGSINVLTNDTDADTPHGDLKLNVFGGSNTGDAVWSSIGRNIGGTISIGTAFNANAQALDDGETATVNIGYVVTDGSASDEGMLVVTVQGVNDAPVAAADSYTVTEDGVLNGTTVLANDTDVDVEPLTAVLVGGPANGGLTLNSDGTFKYTPNANFNGTDSFTYKANDGTVDSATVTVTLNVTPVNDGPVVSNDIGDQVIAEDTPWTFTFASNVFTDVDDAVLTYTASLADGSALPAWLSFDGSSRTFTGTPPQDFNGLLDIRVTATDSMGYWTWDTFDLTITPVNDAPVGGADSYTVAEDGVLNGATVLANDTDAEAQPLTAVLVGGPSNGALTLNADGTFTYTPNANFNGTDSFSYKANDGTADSAAVTVTLNVTPVNDAPTAADNVLGDIAEDSGPYAIAAATLLAGDTDIDGDTLTVTAVSAAVGGAVSLSGGAITFTPTTNYYGPASFTYTVSDGAGGTDTATASFNVTPVNNDAPTFSADSASVSVAENTTAVGTFVAADPDQTGPTYSLSGVNASYFTINAATGALSFAAAPDFEALTVNPLYVTVIATDADNNAVTDEIDLTVTVTNVDEPTDNQPPEEEPEQPPPNPNPGQGEADPKVLLNDAFRNIMRYEVDTKYRPLVDALAEQVTDGDMTLDEAIGTIVDWADGTTAVATLAYQLFGDAVPTAAGLDWLVAPNGPNPNSLNEDYYASFSLDSRYINFAVNLGTQGTTGQAFALEYGAMSVDDAAKAIYLEIFGFAADQAKIDALMDGQVSNGLGGTMTREAYLRSISGGEDIGLKAAFAGWLLSYAATADEGVYADANEAFLMDIADGGTYNVNIIGVYAEG